MTTAEVEALGSKQNPQTKLSLQVLVYHIHWHQESYVVSISSKLISCFLFVQHDVKYLGRLKKDIILFYLEILLHVPLTIRTILKKRT